MNPETYLFIDGGHLRKNYAAGCRAWFGHPGQLDIAQVVTSFNASKCFYYDCADTFETREGEDPMIAKAKTALQEAFFDEIQSHYGTHVKLGKLTGNGEKKRQKQVDIMLAVDSLNHAQRGNMGRVVLLTGDDDFTPVVKSLVDMGIFVTAAGDKFHTSKSLKDAADDYRPLTISDYYLFTKPIMRQPNELPSVTTQIRDVAAWVLVKQGIAGVRQPVRVELHTHTKMRGTACVT